MEWVKTTDKIPIKSWCKDIEENAMEQVHDLAILPFAFKHIAIMPDCHMGYGMPIGGVLAADGVVIPNAVGVDIGCGMCAVKTNIATICDGRFAQDMVKAVMSGIRMRIPIGFNHHKEPQEWKGFDDAPDTEVVQQQLESSRKQLGTLGGGNHFIEIQIDQDGLVWLMIHSGSRNFGLRICNFYHEKARRLCERWYSDIPNKDLSFLPVEDNLAKDYMASMQFALDFALESRHRMMQEFKESLKSVCAPEYHIEINIHHNYARWEHHFGKNVIIHRKGATSAKQGEAGIIPGSQGACSYIVEGRGNADSFGSCSHGAGRKMGRRQAKRELSLKDERKKLDDLGIVHSVRNQDDLDEAPGAYKDIEEVMDAQEDLVRIETKLTPLGVIKA